MHEEYEPVPVSPAVRVAIGMAVAVFIVIVAQVSGFVNVAALFGGDGDVAVDDPSTSTVPGTLAFEDEDSDDAGSPAAGSDDGGTDGTSGGADDPAEGDDDGTGSTSPTILETIELNPEVTIGPTTTTMPEQASTPTGVDETTSTTEEPVDDVDTDDTIPPQFDENGDPIPVPDEEQPTENEPVRRTYNDYDGGAS